MFSVSVVTDDLLSSLTEFQNGLLTALSLVVSKAGPASHSKNLSISHFPAEQIWSLLASVRWASAEQKCAVSFGLRTGACCTRHCARL